MTTNSKGTNTIRLLAMLVCAAWLGFVVWRAYAGWPRLPLDVNAGDPVVLEVYQSAVHQHALSAMLLGFAPLPLVYAIAKLMRR